MPSALTAKGPEPLAGMVVADGAAATSAQVIAFDSTTSSVRNALRGAAANIQKKFTRGWIRATGGRRRAAPFLEQLSLWK